MSIVLNRRVKLRDDGSGQGDDEPRLFSEFNDDGAIILLGDPGLGKTTLFRTASGGTSISVRNFLIDPASITSTPLFLDGLDEFRSLSNGDDSVGVISKTLIGLGKPKFRVSCRSADWFGSIDRDAIRLASSSNRVVVLELLPLTKEDVQIAVKDLIPDPAKFLEEAEKAGLESLLGNPQTLELIAYAWRAETKPRNRFEAYDIGISEVIKEMNVIHAGRGSALHSSRDLRTAAGAVCSALLISNSVGISRSIACANGEYALITDVTHARTTDVDEALKRRVFTSTGTDIFEPTHRTLAEFLAAEDLARRIQSGLPIGRVMALISGLDGKPVSSLRGLFAWLMPRLGPTAEGYISLDPYAVATYGDASALTPKGQAKVWEGLADLQDPWFLAKENDRGSFRLLANAATREILNKLLTSHSASIHLKVAALEAIANSTPDRSFSLITRDIALQHNPVTWIRRAALRAYLTCVQENWAALETFDKELTVLSDDDAPVLRLDLLLATTDKGDLAARILSILAQAATRDEERRAIGYFSRLRELPKDSNLDAVLDGASGVLTEKHYRQNQFELRSIFKTWLVRRLKEDRRITPMQLSCWLKGIRANREHHDNDENNALAFRFKMQPELFEQTYEFLVANIDTTPDALLTFISQDFWKMIPPSSWPLQPSVFFLNQARKEKDASRAAELYSLHQANFPNDVAAFELAENSLLFIENRPDIAAALGQNWNLCFIADWRTKQAREIQKHRVQMAKGREKNIAHLSPRLESIRNGTEATVLVEATKVYFGQTSRGESLAPHARLESVSNDAIADAIVEGFSNYPEHTTQTADGIIEGWISNSIPWAAFTLCLSVFYRRKTARPISGEALEKCIAAALIVINAHGDVEGLDEVLHEWLVEQALAAPEVVASLLQRLWKGGLAHRNGSLPGLYELRKEPRLSRFMVGQAQKILGSNIQSIEAISRFVAVLVESDPPAAIAIGAIQVTQTGLSEDARVLWSSVLFALSPHENLSRWQALCTAPRKSLWQAIKFFNGDSLAPTPPPTLSAQQRCEIIMVIGRQFPAVEHPSSGWSGDTNPWDATEFISRQITLLCTDEASEVDDLISRILKSSELSSYREFTRHHAAQRQKARREHSFSFGTLSQVAKALDDQAPATSSDLLAHVVDHLSALSHELRHTQRERYRAYWNQRRYELVNPKPEPDCSGLLAEDLQNRLRAHDLIVTTEHHMVADKKCDLVVLQGLDRLLPIEAKHHYHKDLWTAWKVQLDALYTRDAQAGGLGVYLVFWSGIASTRKVPPCTMSAEHPTSAESLARSLSSLIPEKDRLRLRVVVVDISPVSATGSPHEQTTHRIKPARKSHGVSKGRQKTKLSNNKPRTLERKRRTSPPNK